MKVIIRASLCAWSVSMAAGMALAAQGGERQPRPWIDDAAPGRLIDGSFPKDGYHPERVTVRIRDTASPLRRGAIDASINVKETVFESRLVPGLRTLRVPAGTVDEAIAKLRANPEVLYAERDTYVYAQAQTTPYGITNVRAPQAWSTTRGSGVRIAVLDSGYDVDHPDLPTPVAAASFISGQSATDGHGHGTHVSGTVLARDDTNFVVGVAPQADLVIGKVLSNFGSGSSAAVTAGIEWAVEQGARVINMSLGSGTPDTAMQDACAAALARGTLVVCSAGNGGNTTPNYPASFPECMAISSVESNNLLSSFSTFGPQVSLAAPGGSVLSLAPGGQAVWGGATRSGTLFQGTATTEVTAKVYFCGLGGAAADFPAGVAGNIAHIRRGTFTFVDKINNAIAAGAAGVIISNNTGGLLTIRLSDNIPIPAIMLSQTDGNSLQALANGTTITMRAFGLHTTATLSGTSMASPHVAGVAGLVLAKRPSLTPAQVRLALEASATDLGTAGRDDLYGAGLVNAQAALNYLVNLPCNRADLTGPGGPPALPDGDLSVEDFIAFLATFTEGCSVTTAPCNLADLTGPGGSPTSPDGDLSVDDFIEFLAEFSEGCP